MAQVIQRYFWLLSVVTVVICGTLAARAANHVVESEYLDTGAGPAPAVAMAPTAQPRRAVPDPRGAGGAALVERNMFCSDCTIADDRIPVEVEGASGDAIPMTTLPLELLATNLGSRPEHSFATIRNTASAHQGAFWSSGSVPGAGPIETIGGTYVTFHNPETNRIEKLSLLAQRAPARPAARATPRAARTSNAFADQIEKLGDNSYRVERSLITQVVGNPTRVGARIRPVAKDGEVSGFRVYAVRPSSPLAAIGLKNGDTIHSINGFPMSTSPDQMLELYTKLKDANNVSIEITRRGQKQTMSYQVQ